MGVINSLQLSASFGVWQLIYGRLVDAENQLDRFFDRQPTPAEVVLEIVQQVESSRTTPEQAMLLLGLISAALQLFESKPAASRMHVNDFAPLKQEFPQHANLIEEIVQLHLRHCADIPVTTAYVGSPSSTELGRTAADDQTTETRILFGNHELRGDPREGGMGRVYRAFHTLAKRNVALKQLKPNFLAPHLTELFKTEVQALSRMRHTNIVAVHETGTCNGIHYFTMDWIAGGTLEEQLSSGALDQQRAARIGKKIAEALHYAHVRNVRHRDVKPRNILMDENDEPVLCDFGLARIIADDEVSTTSDHGICGTHGYMSPEQARGFISGAEAECKSDIFSLGATLYHILLGEPPYVGRSEETRERERRGQLVPAGKHHAVRLHPDLAAIVDKCLAAEPSQRYSSAKEVADDLDRCLRNEPVTARPISFLQQIWRTAQRKPLETAFTLLTVLILGVGFGLWLRLNQTKQQRDVATIAKNRAVIAEAAKRKSLAQSHADTARLSMARAENRKAVELFDKALAEGYPDPVEIRLEKVAAFVTLSEDERAQRELDELNQLPGLGKHTGKVRMWQAEYALPHNSAEAIRLYQTALTHELSPADRLYVEGMLSDTSPSALQKFEAAIELSPFHERALGMSMLMLILLGRLDEASARLDLLTRLYPDDRHTFATRAMVLAILGRTQDALRVIENPAVKLTETQKRDYRQVIEFVGDVGSEMSFIEDAAGPKMREAAIQLLPIILQGRTFLPVQKRGVHLPPRIASRFEGIVLTLPALTLGHFQPLAHRLESILEVNPEGTMYFLHGLVKGSDEDYAAAKKSFEAAMNCPAALEFVHREAGLSLAMLYANDYLLATNDDGQARRDEQARDKAMHWTEFALKQNVSFPEPCCAVLTKAAVLAGRLDLADQTIDRWQKIERTGEGEFVYWQARVALERQEYYQAYVVAGRALEIDPQSQRASLVRTMAREKLDSLSFDDAPH